jgi:predicted RNA-binding protein with PUA-like domain
MKKGDLVLFYHSVTDPSVVGIAKVSREAYPDPTAKEGDWSCVDLVPVRPLSKSVTLAYIKSHPALSEIALIRQSRLSVMPISPKEYAQITGVSGSNK